MPDEQGYDPNKARAQVMAWVQYWLDFFAEERRLCSECGWDAYSRAKGNHRWLIRFYDRAVGVDPASFNSLGADRGGRGHSRL